MNYITLRLLGVDRDEPMMIKARATLHALGEIHSTASRFCSEPSSGGATAVPTWGKAWLSILNVYEWDGMNAIPPELW